MAGAMDTNKAEEDALYKVYIVAELGTAHRGNLDHAFALIDAAREAGADCAKFQLVIADEIIHPETGYVELPGGKVALYETFKRLEQPLGFYARLAEHCSKKDLDFLCTPFGLKSARLLNELGVSAFKIASPEVNHFPLLRQIRAFRKPVIMSTGVSLLSDIERAVQILGRDELTLLHCVTAYPAPEQEYNVRTVSTLASIFGVPTGISDHSTDPVLVPALATLCGAKIVEKHFTLSRKDGGLDDPIALPPAEFRQMSAAIRKVEEALAASEEPEEVIDVFREEYTARRVDAVLGSGIKTLSPAEAENYGRTNRSIHALGALPAGTIIQESDLALLRTEKNLRPGLPPEFLPEIIGARTARTVAEGEGVVLDDLLFRE